MPTSPRTARLGRARVNVTRRALSRLRCAYWHAQADPDHLCGSWCHATCEHRVTRRGVAR